MNKILPYFIPLTILALFIAALVYVSRRFAFYFGSPKRRNWYVLFGALFVYMAAGWMVFENMRGWPGHILYMMSAFLMGFLLYLLLMVLLMGLVRRVIKIKPLAAGITVLTLTLLVSVYGVIRAFDLKITRVEIPLKGLSDEVKIMHLSDLHLGHFRGPGLMDRIVVETNRVGADLVVITGDYLDSRIALNPDSFDPLTRFGAPVFFIGGNHDEYTGLEEIQTRMRDAGVRVLMNETVRTHGIQLVGLNYMTADTEAFDMHPPASGQNLKEVLPNLVLSRDIPVVLLHHSPVGVKYAARAGANLYLAGHTHGGQLFPVSLINRVFFPYSRGLFQTEDLTVFVSEGVGTFGPPMRIGTRSEVVLITLRPWQEVMNGNEMREIP